MNHNTHTYKLSHGINFNLFLKLFSLADLIHCASETLSLPCFSLTSLFRSTHMEERHTSMSLNKNMVLRVDEGVTTILHFGSLDILTIHSNLSFKCRVLFILNEINFD